MVKKNNVPKIRFKDFTEEWEKRKYEDIGNCFQGGNLGYSDLDKEGKYKCILYGDLYTRYDAIIENVKRRTNKKGNLVLKNDILFPQSTTVDAMSLISPACMNDKKAYTSGVFIIRPHRNIIDGNFVSYYSKGNIEQRRKLSKNAQGLTIVHLYYNSIKNEKIMTPKYKEQIRISECFKQLDNLITLHQRKYDKYKKIKNALLEKMFPKKGSKIPEIRFKGFTDNWEQRELGEISDIVGGGTPNTNITDYWDGDINWYTPAEIGKQIYTSCSERKISKLGYKNSSAKMLPINTILFTSRAGIGKTAILLTKACTNQGFQSIIPDKNKLNYYFIFSRTNELKKYGETVGSGSTFVEVSKKQMENMKLMIPTTITEQKIIGQYFSNLDNLITLHQDICEKLKNIKKALLEKMFI